MDISYWRRSTHDDRTEEDANQEDPERNTRRTQGQGSGKEKPTKRRWELVLCYDCIQCYFMFDVNT